MSCVSVDVDLYRQHGYVAMSGLVTPDEISALREDAVRICRGEYPCEQLPPASAAESDEQALSRYLCIHHPHKISPVILAMIRHPAIVEVLTTLIGPNVKCMQSMLFIKPPRFPGQACHQDEIYIPTRDRSLTGAWIALDDATVENGCLWVLPGSHADGILYQQRDHGNPLEFDSAQEAYGFDGAAEIPVECRAGDVLFFNGYLLHRSRKNRSTRYRRVLVNHYMNANSLLPWLAATADGVPAARADHRDIIMVAGTDPYAAAGIENICGIHVRPFDPRALEVS